MGSSMGKARNRWQPAHLIGVALVGFHTISAHAQTTASPDGRVDGRLAPAQEPPRNIGESDRAPATDTIVVTGQRLPEIYAGGQVARGAQLCVLGNATLLDVPLSINAYTSEYVRNQQAVSVADVLSADPSARAFTSNRAGVTIETFSIRGFQVNAFNVSIQGLGALTGLSEPLEGIERVEVLQGPSSLLNGFPLHGGVGGTINLVPARATEQPLTRSTAGYASDMQFSGAVDIGRRFGSRKQFGLRVNGLYRNGNAAIDGHNSKLGLLTAGFDYSGDAVRLSADVRYSDNRNRQPQFQITVFPGFAIPDAPKASRSYTQPWTFQNYTNLFGALRGEVDVTQDLTLFATVGVRHMKGRNLVTLPLLVNAAGDLNDLALYFPVDFRTLSAEAGVRAHVSTGPVEHRLTIAGSGIWEDRVLEGTGAVLGAAPSNIYRPVAATAPGLAALPPFRRNSNEQYKGMTISDTMSGFDDGVQLTLGARIQDARIDVKNPGTGVRTDLYKANATTPFAGLTVKPMKTLSLYASYSEGLDVGGAAPAGSANAGAFLPPAKLRQTEAGLKYDAGTTLIQFSAFDLRQQSGFSDPVTRVFALAGRQQHRGVEFNAAGEPTRGARILGGVMYLDGKLTRTPGGVNDGRKPVGVPEWTVNAGGEVDILPRFTLTGRILYTSRQFVDPANTQPIPGWTRMDLGARMTVSLAHSPIIFRLNIENLFDKSFYASAFSGVTLGAPRTVALSASVEL